MIWRIISIQQSVMQDYYTPNYYFLYANMKILFYSIGYSHRPILPQLNLIYYWINISLIKFISNLFFQILLSHQKKVLLSNIFGKHSLLDLVKEIEQLIYSHIWMRKTKDLVSPRYVCDDRCMRRCIFRITLTYPLNLISDHTDCMSIIEISTAWRMMELTVSNFNIREIQSLSKNDPSDPVSVE